MQINIIKNTKEDSEKKIKIFLKKKKTKGGKRSIKDINIFLKKKSRCYLSI